MKFDKLVKILTEAKGTKPGERYFNAKNSDPTRKMKVGSRQFVAPISSSPVGKVDNFEVREKSSGWEFDPNVDVDMGGVRKQSKAWRTLYNAFSLLANDENFKDEVKTIADNFDKERDSYKNVRGITDGEEVEKYDEESRVNTLPQTLDKQKSKRTEYETQIAKRRTVINYTKMGPSAKFELEKEIESLRGTRKAILKALNKTKLSYTRKTKLEGELIDVNKKLDRLEDRLQMVNASNTESMKSEIFDFEEKIKKLDKKIAENEAELKTLTDRTTKIQSNNEENNDIAIKRFKDQVVHSAKKIKSDLGEQLKSSQSTEEGGTENIENVQVDWNDIPKQFKTKVKMLDALISTDPAVNPIFGYIDSFNNWYYSYSDTGEKSRVKDLDEREFNPQLNITKIRDYMSLPFVRLMSVYASASIPKMSLKKEADLKAHAEVYNNFVEYIKQFPNARDPVTMAYNKKAWEDEETKEMLRSFIAGMAIEDKSSEYDKINDSWGVSRTGFNSFHQLKSMVDTDMKRFIPKTESFDRIFGKIINEKVWDEDDFKLDIMEVLSSLKNK